MTVLFRLCIRQFSALLVITFAISASSSAQLPTEKYRELLSQLKQGTTNRQAKELIAQCATEYGEYEAISYDQPVCSRYQLDDETYLILKFSRTKQQLCLSPDDLVSSSQLVRLDNLRGEIPVDVFDSIRVIHKSPKPSPYGFDPVRLIRAVNHLRSLGKNEALRRLRFYHDMAIKDNGRSWRYDLDKQRIFLIARLLFIRRDGRSEMPDMRIGGTAPDAARGDPSWPLFPLVVSNDIPFFMASGYSLAGCAESPLAHLKFCEGHCELRRAALVPSESPVVTVNKIYASPEWIALFRKEATGGSSPSVDSLSRYVLRWQAVKCLPKPYNSGINESDFNPYCPGEASAEQSWEKHLSKLGAAEFHWNAKMEVFEVNVARPRR